jgi:hypothetical protein
MPCSGAQSNWWESDSKRMGVINPGNKLLGGPENNWFLSPPNIACTTVTIGERATDKKYIYTVLCNYIVPTVKGRG